MLVRSRNTLQFLSTENIEQPRGGAMDENDHPKGALLLIIAYLTLLSVMWLNVYLHLFGKGWPR